MSGKVPLVRQVTESECGLCCCLMLLRYLKSKESVQELQEYFDTGRDGISLLSIKKYLRGRGIESKVFSIKDINVFSKTDGPFICFINDCHFVIIEKVKDKKIYVLDPAQGKQIYSFEKFKEVFSGTILVMTSTEKFVPKKTRTYSPWKFIWNMITERKVLILEIMVMAGISYGISLAMPILIQKILDKTITTTSPGYLKSFAIIIAVCSIMYFFILMLEGIRTVTLNVFLGIRLEAGTYERLLGLPYKYFETRATGDLMHRIQSATAIKEMISTNIISTVINIGSCVVIVFYMFNKSIIMSVMALILFTLNIMVILVLQPLLTQAVNSEIMEQSKSQTAQIESLYTIMQIKISGMEDKVYSNWHKIYSGVINIFKKRMVISMMYSNLTGVLQTFSPIILLCLGIKEYFEGNVSLGEVVAFQSIAATFFSLGVSIVNTYPNFVQTTQYLDRLTDIWGQTFENKINGEKKSKLKGDIELRNISFSYSKNSATVLDDISLKIKGGSKVAIVGASGSGKSSLCKILVRLYEPSMGQIIYDGKDINEYDHNSLCNQISIVPQDSMLFNKKI